MDLYLVICFLLLLFASYSVSIGSREVCLAWPEKPKSHAGSRHYYASKWIYILLIVFFWFLTAFRAINIGNDTATYVAIFRNISVFGINDISRWEIGFQVYCWLISRVSMDPHIFLIVTATICYLFTGAYVYKYSKNILFSLCLLFCFCFTIYTSMLRQDIAMVIFLYAYHYFKENKRILALLLILLAGTFHYTAFVCLIIFLYNHIPIKWKTVLAFSLIMTGMAMTGLVENIVSNALNRVGLAYFVRYFENIYSQSGWLGATIDLLKSFLIFLVAFFSLYEKKISKETKLILVIFSIQVIINSMGYSMNMMSRISEYFMLITMVELPNAIIDGRFRNKPMWVMLICVFSIGLFITIQITRPNWNHIYPYQFWQY